MHLVPETAIVEQSPQRTFAQLRESMVLNHRAPPRLFGSNTDVPTVGCGSLPDREAVPLVTADISAATERRRLSVMVDDASVCNNVTNFYCWMSCLDIPKADQAQGYINEGYSLYCVDPSVLAGSGGRVSDAIKPCNEQGVTGLAMNTNCMGSWQPTAPGVPAQEVLVEGGLFSQDEEPFCWGATSMYMDGFNMIGTTCAVYLFPNWILDTAGKLVAACLGSVAFGALMEFVIRKRREVTTAVGPGHQRLVLSALFYGLQLTMGYSLMLIIMIYSVPLFFSVILGLVLGHVLFNAKDSIIPSGRQTGKSANHKDSPDCCNGSNKTNSDQELNQPSCCGGSKSDTNDAGVPEGSTPCCQHTL